MESKTEAPKFIRAERYHLEALEARLAHLKENRPERSGDPAYPPGEAAGLAWAIAVIRGIEEPVELRVERMQDLLRRLSSRVGRVEAMLAEDEEDDGRS